MKKYVAKWKRKKIVLSQNEYKILLERFDLSNFKVFHNGLINRISCPLCKSDIQEECGGCPFNLYRKDVGCTRIIKEVLKKIVQKPFLNMYIYRNNIKLLHNIEEGRRAIALIRELLITRFQAEEVLK